MLSGTRAEPKRALSALPLESQSPHSRFGFWAQRSGIILLIAGTAARACVGVRVGACVCTVLIDRHAPVGAVKANGGGIRRRSPEILDDRCRRHVAGRSMYAAVPAVSFRYAGHRAATVVDAFAKFGCETRHLPPRRLIAQRRVLGVARAAEPCA